MEPPRTERAAAPSPPAGRLRRGRWEYVAATLIFLGLTAWFFGPLFRGYTLSAVAGHQSAVFPWRALPNEFQDSYPQSDQADLNYPWQTFITDSLRAGAFPFWDPYSFGGHPFFSNGQSAVIYPPRFFSALALSPSWAHDLFSVLHVALSALFMFLMAKELGTGFAGATLAAVAWMFAAFNLAWLQLEVVVPVFVFLPASCLFVHRAARRRSWKTTAAAVLVLGMLLVSGHLPFVGFTYLVAVSYAACLSIRVALRSRGSTGRRAAGKELLRAIVTALAPLAVAAGALLPTIAFLLHDLNRPQPSYELAHAAIRVRPSAFLNVFLPPAVPITEGRMHEMVFVGTATLAFAALGALQRRPGTGLARILAAAVLLVALDTPALWLAFHLIPGFGYFRPLGRLLYLFSFAVALLGGIGLDFAMRWSRRRRPGVPPSRQRTSREWAMIAIASLAVGLTVVQL
ncbi:MAG: hypothetical protein ACRDIF_05055, partial [Actinomycetota bacterium]